jgi:hypothetical protein
MIGDNQITIMDNINILPTVKRTGPELLVTGLREVRLGHR